MIDRKNRKRIQTLKERGVQRNREIAELSSTISRLTATIEAIRTSLC
jgi:prefoldin subunit 5